MGLLDWSNEYVNPFADSHRERAEREEKAKRKRDARSEVPRHPNDLMNPGAGGVAVPAPNADTPEARMAILARNYGVDEDTVRREVLDGGARKNIGEMLAELHKFSDEEVERLQRQLLRGGFYRESIKAKDVRWRRWDLDTLNATVNMLNESSRMNASGDERDWREVLAEAESGGVDEQGQGKRSVTASVANLSTRGEARQTLRQAMQDLLGRDPTSKEVRRFHRRMNEQEQANPVQRRQVGLGFDDIETDTDEIQDGGFAEGDAEMLAEEDILAENGVEAGAYRIGRATNIFESMMTGG